jgi:hypothetical protein
MVSIILDQMAFKKTHIKVWGIYFNAGKELLSKY